MGKKKLKASCKRKDELLARCVNQLDYLNDKFTETATSNSIISMIEIELASKWELKKRKLNLKKAKAKKKEDKKSKKKEAKKSKKKSKVIEVKHIKPSPPAPPEPRIIREGKSPKKPNKRKFDSKF